MRSLNVFEPMQGRIYVLEGAIIEFQGLEAILFVEIELYYIYEQINFTLKYICLTFSKLYVYKQSCFKTPKFLHYSL